jgi:predicted aldo/keto reductase-like oxidoreductase
MEAMGLHGSVYWHPEISDHYRFVLSRPEIDGILMGPKTPEELQGVAEALARGPLTEEEQDYLMHVALVARGEAKVEPEEQVFA